MQIHYLRTVVSQIELDNGFTTNCDLKLSNYVFHVYSVSLSHILRFQRIYSDFVRFPRHFAYAVKLKTFVVSTFHRRVSCVHR